MRPPGRIRVAEGRRAEDDGPRPRPPAIVTRPPTSAPAHQRPSRPRSSLSSARPSDPPIRLPPSTYPAAPGRVGYVKPTITRDTGWGIRIATWTVVLAVFLAVSGVILSLPGMTLLAAGAVGGVTAGLAWASWACLRAWWRG